MEKQIIRSTCGYCSTGCNFKVRLDRSDQYTVSPNSDYPVNKGMSCPKGFLFLEHLHAPDRAETPYVKNNKGQLAPVDWNTAIRAFCDNFKGIQRTYGKASIAFLGTGQMPMEELAFLGALAKFGMEMIHGDGNTLF